MESNRKPRLAVWKFASCDGCQLSLLDCEEQLLQVAEAVEIAYFPEASRTMAKGPYDVALVEGSITTPHDAERIHQVRRSARILVAIGACATAGGIQALRNFGDLGPMIRSVYASPQHVAALAKSTPISDHVFVDHELRGCPVNKLQLVDLLAALLSGRRPTTRSYSVCLECKRSGTVCLAVTAGARCMGPLTHGGCGALCPSFHRPCFGCYGPKESPNTPALARIWRKRGATPEEIVGLFRSYNAYAEPFRRESEAHEPGKG